MLKGNKLKKRRQRRLNLNDKENVNVNISSSPTSNSCFSTLSDLGKKVHFSFVVFMSLKVVEIFCFRILMFLHLLQLILRNSIIDHILPLLFFQRPQVCYSPFVYCY